MNPEKSNKPLPSCQRIARQDAEDSFDDGDQVLCFNFDMKVKRIVANIETTKISAAKRFYEDVLKLDILMDMDWIATYGTNTKMPVQISFMSEGGSGTKVPDLSIEVDDVDEAFKQMKKARFKIEYPLTDEPWGVRRFYVRDPMGRLVNILAHV